MTLTKKIALTLAITVLVFLLLNLLIVNYLLAGTFESYEDEEVTRNTVRVLQSIDSTYDTLHNRDWAVWTETFDFLHGENEGFAEENLDGHTLVNLGINMMILADRDGQIRWSDLTSLENGIPLELDASYMPPHLQEKQLAENQQEPFSYSGILSTAGGPMLITAQPVLLTDGSGPAAGTMVLGRFIDDLWMAQTADATRVDLAVYYLPDDSMPAHLRQVVADARQNNDLSSSLKNDDIIRNYRLVSDLAGSPAILIETVSPRDIRNNGRRVQSIATGTLISAGLAILVVLTVVLRRLVTSPLNQLTGHIRQIQKTGEIPEVAQTMSDDEIGSLARHFMTLMCCQKAAEEKSQLLSKVIESSAKSIAFTDAELRIQYANSTFRAHLDRHGCNDPTPELKTILIAQGQSEAEYDAMLSAVNSGKPWSCEIVTQNEGGPSVEEVMHISPVKSTGEELQRLLISYQDVSEKNAMERMLLEAQRLESVGQLAAGVAHEINTPIQFVGDNVRFVKESFADIDEMLKQLMKLCEGDQQSIDIDVVRASLEKMDAEYLIEEMPTAIDQTLDGIARVSKIVGAMKAFSHPSEDQALVDINQAIESTVTVASNEWKYVAEVQLDLAEDLPNVYCDGGQLNQVVLNMIVNASHALADAGKGVSGELGQISIKTADTGDWAEIRISDNGTGMPEDVRARIFDPFFTTKEVGKGTGQGLSIAYDAVVNKHHGTIEVESELGKGTSFIIRLPINAQNDAGEPVSQIG